MFNTFKVLIAYLFCLSFSSDVESTTYYKDPCQVDHNFQSAGDEFSLFENSIQSVVLVFYFYSYVLIRGSKGSSAGYLYLVLVEDL